MSETLTRREQFAAMAMQGLLSNPSFNNTDRTWIIKQSDLLSLALCVRLDLSEMEKEK